MPPPATAPNAGPVVQAVVLTSGRSGADSGLRALLDAIAASAISPERVVVLDTTAATAGSGAADVVASVQSPTFAVTHERLDPGMPDRAAVASWLATADLADDELLWLLPVGSIPEPQTLGRLLAAHRRSPSVGLVGPKHVDATNPRTLRSVGINTTRTGRVVEDPPLGEPDQGQYDLRRDVLAIPLAGMLASAKLLRELGGWEPSFGDLGGDLDLGWRAQLAGQRVVVAPDARMRSVASVGLATATTGARRRAARRVALTRASWWQAPFLALWILTTTLAAAVGLLLLKRPRPAAEAFADLGSLNPVRGVLSRVRTRGRRVVRHRDIATLFVPASAIVRTGLDRAYEALVAPATLADEDTSEPEDRALISRGALHPGVLAVVATLAVVAAAGREIGGGLLSRFGSGVTGGELITTRATSNSLWHAAFDGWHGTGLGGDGPASPSLALLAIPTWIVEHLPGSGDLTSPAGAVVGALIVLALPLAALSAYVSARVLGAPRTVRALAALAWATTGAAGASVAQGRLGALVALILLPIVLAGVVLLARPSGTATGAFATALGAAVLGAFAPPLLVLVVLVCLGVALFGHPGSRRLVLVPAFLAPLLLGPWLADVVDNWTLAATGPGLSQWGGTSAEPLALALLHPGGAGSVPWWVGAIVVALGLAGLLASTSIRSASTGAALIALVSLAAALAAPHLDLIADSASVAGQSGPVTPWAGTFILPLTLALLTSAVIGVGSLRERRRLSGVAVLALSLSALVGAGALGWFGFGASLRTWTDPRPAVAVEQAAGELGNRTVFVTPGPSGAAYRIVGRETGSLARSLPQSVANDTVIASDVSQLLDGTRSDSGPKLAQHAIGFVAVAQNAGADVARRLDSAQGLSRLASRDGYDIWRIAALGNAANRPVSPTRLAVLNDGDPSLVATTGEHGATDTTVTARKGDVLTVAEPPAWASHATVEIDGRELAATADADRPTYALPVGTHTLTIDVTTDYPWWRALQGLALAIVAFLSVPFGTRASRRRR
ncbi:glycosyltransferase [Janibacter sp. HTCC2649]|uniref:glycosyltransferase n=1 Tax=Janibacter sp. HTCC2649 TaxID=313589 RepID=UPI0013054503|nr:glycosyltransferase [Janibacter sp. HTCC2649]